MLRAFVALVRTVVSLLAAAIRALSAVFNPGVLNFSVTVVRPDDLLVLTFEFFNLSPIDEGGANARLVRNDPGEARITVHFQPQSIVEEASHEDSETSPAPRICQSRHAFRARADWCFAYRIRSARFRLH